MVDLDALKAAIDLRDIARTLLANGKHHQSYDQYPSPFRDDGNNDDFMVYSDGYFDYGSGETKNHGDHIDFLQRLLNYSFQQALEYLQNYAGSSPTPVPKRTEPKPTPSVSEPPAPAWQQEARKVLEAAQQYLWSGKLDALNALEYLYSQTLTDKTLRAFGIGFNPTYREFPDGNLASGIVFPVEAEGILWRLSVRTNNSNSKYTNARGSKLSGLFNADAIQAGMRILIVEGEKDAMVLQQSVGDNVAVVTFGGVSSEPSIRWKNSLQQALKVYILLDNDKAGQATTLEYRAILKLWGIDAQPLTLPEGKDATEYATQFQGDLGAWFEAITRFCWWQDGVPNSWRMIMFKYVPEAAVVTEIINETTRLGLIFANAFTCIELLAAAHRCGYTITRTTLFDAIKVLTERGLIRQLDTKNTEIITISNFRINAKKGRKPIAYGVRSIDDMREILLHRVALRIYEEFHPVEPDKATLAKITVKMLVGIETTENLEILVEEINEVLQPAFDRQGWLKLRAGNKAEEKYIGVEASLNNLESTPLPPKFPKGTLSELRRAFAHAKVKRDGERRYSRREWQDTLGVSDSSLKSILAEAACEKTEQFEYGDNLLADNIPNQVWRQKGALKGHPKSFIIQTGGKKRLAAYSSEALDEIEQLIRDGATVTIKFQVANLYRAVGDEPRIVEKRYRINKGQGTQSRNKRKQEKGDVMPKFYYGLGYSPLWVREQLKLGLRLRGWKDSLNLENKHQELVQHETGTVVSLDASKQQLVEAILGRPLDPVLKDVISQ